MVSIVTYTGDGSTTDYTIPFEYLDDAHVVVELTETVTTAWSFLNETTVRMDTAPATGDRLVIKRATPDAPIVDFTDGSTLFEADLDLSAKQSRLLGSEARDRADEALQLVNNNLTDILAVRAISADVSTVADNDANVTTVADDLNGTDTIGTVSGSITNVNTVGTNIGNVNTTGTNITDVNTVAGSITNVNLVGTDITNVNTVATNVADVNTVSGNIADVNTVASNDANVTTVAGISSDVTTAAGISSDITAVAADATDIGTVSASIANVNTVGTNIANVNTVAANDANVTTVAGIDANVTTVAGIASAVSTNAANIADINAASANAATATTKAAEALASANNAATSASNASTSETNAAASAAAAATSASNLATAESNAAASATAASASQVAAAASAASAATVYDTFDDRYLGSKSTEPTVDNDGDALVQGMLYFNQTANEMRVYDGGSWIAASSAGGASMLEYLYIATASQTAFSGSDANSNTLSYTVGNLMVIVNGVILEPSVDYTATDGSTVTLTDAAALDDEVHIIAFKSFTTADMVSATNGGTFGNGVNILGDVGIGTSSPSNTLHVKSSNPNIRLEDSDGASNIYSQILSDGSGSLFLRADTAGNGSSTKVQFDVDGSERMRIDSSGRVGIGTSSPARDLVVSGDSQANIALQTTASGSTLTDGFQIQADGSHAYLWNYENTNILLGTSNTERMRIESNGYVGIGTTTPSSALEVNGTVTATTVDLGNWTVTESGGTLFFATGGVNKMKLDASGNLTVTGDITAFGTV